MGNTDTAPLGGFPQQRPHGIRPSVESLSPIRFRANHKHAPAENLA